MATKKLNTRIQNKIDSEANWNNNPDFIPLKGEMIVYSKDANNKAARVKFGDGVTKLKNLKFSGGSGVPLTPVKKPTVRGSLTYNKSSQTPTWVNYDSSKMTLSGTTSATNAGTYTAKFTPLTGYCWEDDESTSAINVTWTINKAPANLRLSSTLLGIDSTFEGKTFTYTTSSSGSISVSYEVYTAEGTLIESAFNTTVGSSSITITKPSSVNDISYGTITVTQAATINYLEANVEITVQAVIGLDEYSWEEIKNTVSSSTTTIEDFAAIGDTKTITLTPNQRIRLPQGEENVKVFLADVFKDSDGDNTMNGALFAGFKDSDGKDIAITPDPKIREKKLLLAGIYNLMSETEGSGSDGIDECIGTHVLSFSGQDPTDTFSSITITKEDANIYNIYYDSTLMFKTNPQDGNCTIVNTAYSPVHITHEQYIDPKLYTLLFDWCRDVTFSNYSFRFKDTIERSNASSSVSVDVTFNTLNNTEYTKLQFEEQDGDGDWRMYFVNSRAMYLVYSDHSSWSISTYRTIQLRSSIDCYHAKWLLDNTEITRTINGYWEAKPNGASIIAAATIMQDAQFPTKDVNGVEGYLLSVQVTINNNSYDGIFLELNHGGALYAVTTDYGDHTHTLHHIAAGGDTGLNFTMWIQSEIDNDPLWYSAIATMCSQYKISGSWIWNPSVAENLSSLSRDRMININFRAGDIIAEDGLPQMQYCINPTNADGFLGYEGPNGVTLVGGGVFHPEYAAMHFGDEPQSVPKYFYDFLVANADYMSEGFMSNTQVPETAFSYWYQTNLRHYVLGGCTEDGVLTSGNAATNVLPNTLMEVLPSDLRAVLSPIGDGSGYQQTMDYLTLPNPTELNFPITYIQGTTRLGANATDWGYKINYYKNANPTAKYDIWNKNSTINWFTAAGYYPSDGGGTMDAPMYWVLAGTDTQQNSPTYVKKCAPELLTAGLAPIFLIGSTTGEQ